MTWTLILIAAFGVWLIHGFESEAQCEAAKQLAEEEPGSIAICKPVTDLMEDRE